MHIKTTSFAVDGFLRYFFLAILVCFLPHCQKAANEKHVNNLYPQNIILLIGDGMGPQQMGLLESYARLAPNSKYQGNNTAINRFAAKGVLGLSLTEPHNALVTDSACAASQLASGHASRSEMIGLDINGNRVQTILQYAKNLNKSTGLVSDTRLTHATPAAFASHQAHRSMENEIAAQMLEENKVDVMLSGGLRHFLPKDAGPSNMQEKTLQQIQDSGLTLKSSRQDNRNLLVEAQSRNYQLAFNRTDMQQASGQRLLGLFATSGMQDGTRHLWNPSESEPSLREMTVKALDILSKNPNGFFLMVEGGQIDWAAHNNDAGRLLHEMLRFDEAVEAVYQWSKNRKDTLVIITADHETGGFGFSYTGINIPEPIALAGEAFKTELFTPNFNFGDVSLLDALYRQQKSFVDMWSQARKGKTFPDADSLMESVNDSSMFEITLQEAERILQREANQNHLDGHKYLKAKEVPKIDDFKEFYVYGDEVHLNLIGRALAKNQNVVWSTGTHTHTPVVVISWGPQQSVFNGIQNQALIGEKMRAALR